MMIGRYVEPLKLSSVTYTEDNHTPSISFDVWLSSGSLACANFTLFKSGRFGVWCITDDEGFVTDEPTPLMGDVFMWISNLLGEPLEIFGTVNKLAKNVFWGDVKEPQLSRFWDLLLEMTLV